MAPLGKEMRHSGGRQRAWGVRVLAWGFLLAPVLTLAVPAFGQPASIAVSRNLFHAQVDRPVRPLVPGAWLSLGPERLEASGAGRLRLVSPSPKVFAALRFRALAEDESGWLLTVVLTTLAQNRDFYYLGQGQRAVQGKLEPQPSYRADGLETELAAANGEGRLRQVRAVVIQDDGQAEVRVILDGDTLQIQAIPPEHGGRPNPPRFADGKGPPLRFLGYRLLGGGYTDNTFGEAWTFEFVVLRANYFTNDTETRGIGRLAIAQQIWRSERWSVWLEGGAAVSQRRDEKTETTSGARLNLAAAVTGHWRHDHFGASLHLGQAGGPLLVQLLGGWQFAARWGALVSWQQVKESSGFGLGLSVNW